MKLNRKIDALVRQDTYNALKDISTKACQRLSVVERQAIEEYIKRNKDKKQIELGDHGYLREHADFNELGIPVSFFVTPDMYDELKALAYRTDLPVKTVSSVARQALAEYIQRNKELFT